MLRLIPPPLHRALYRLAHRVRGYWRRWARPEISGVSVIVTDAQDRILLVRHSYGPQAWLLPGGGLKSQEEPLAAARREMREELGIELDGLRQVGTLEEVLSGAPHHAHVVTGRARGVPEPDGREVAAAGWFDAARLPLGTSTRTITRIRLLMPDAVQSRPDRNTDQNRAS